MTGIPDIIIYGTKWCRDCNRVRRFFDKQTIRYRWINIDEDGEGEQIVLKLNCGMRSVPTIIFQDGSILVEPTIAALARKLGI